MARITVEDCLNRIANPFELVLLAAQRSRDLLRGMPSDYDLAKEKLTVVALREIADGVATREELIRQLPSMPQTEKVESEAKLVNFEETFMESLNRGDRQNAEDMMKQEIESMSGFTDALEAELNDST